MEMKGIYVNSGFMGILVCALFFMLQAWLVVSMLGQCVQLLE